MLDQLVESRNNAHENTRRSGFLLTTLVIMCSLLLAGWVYSLFAKDYGVSDDLELSTLVAPVPIAEEEPPPPEPEKPEPERKVEQQTDKPQIATRTELIQRLDQTPVKPPDTVSTQQSKVPPMPKGPVKIGTENYTPPAGQQGPARANEGGGGGGIVSNAPPRVVEERQEEKKPPPPPPPPPPAPPPPPSKPISKGVVNGSAVSLPEPPYPPAAKAVSASGAVNVQVLIDESGNVVSANAVSGHPLLRQAAEGAARRAKFRPTLLSGQAVKVNGVIVYNFKL